jgi:hypothetical protein
MLTVIIDANGLQSYGATSDVLNLAPLGDKWRAFGFGVCDVDGHDTCCSCWKRVSITWFIVWASARLVPKPDSW